MLVPAYRHFKLIYPIDTVPAGATGQLKRPDAHHVSLIFDHYDDLVFDIHDTDPCVWAAVQPHTINPSLTDPPRFRWRLVAAVVIAFLVGWLALPQPNLADTVAAHVLGFNSD